MTRPANATGAATMTLPEIAKKIRPLAQGDSAGAVSLRGLADTLDGARHSHLVGADLARMYPPEALLPDVPSRPGRLAGIVELLRDILIFVPVLYTWWRISGALDAYADYRAEVPFILAWQRGFGRGVEPLSTSASVVAGVVLVVILLTVVSYLLQNRHEVALRTREQDLTAYLATATELLRRSMSIPSKVSSAELKEISSAIVKSSHALRTAMTEGSQSITTAVNTNPGSKLHEMFERWTSAAAQLTELGNRLRSTQETADLLSKAQSELSTMSAQITGSTARVLEALEQERAVSQQHQHANRRLADEMEKSTQGLKESMNALSAHADDITELVLRMTYVVNRLDPGSESGR